MKASSVFTQKKKIVIVANCQAFAYQEMLKTAFGDQSFEVKVFLNFRKEQIPPEVLQVSDYFIYQDLIQPDLQDYLKLAKANLKPGCVTVCVPKLNFYAYWPTSVKREERFTVSNDFPYGLYPHGDALLIDLMKKYENPEKIFTEYINADLAAHYDLDDVLNKSTAYFLADHNSKDIDVSEFIHKQFSKYKLFHTFNHPSYVLFDFVFKKILDIFGFEYDKKLCYAREDIFSVIMLPVHQSLIRYFNLKFPEPEHYSFWNNKITLRQYVMGYILNVNPVCIE